MVEHPKSVRGRILRLLYERYQVAPLDMLGPDDFFEAIEVSRQGLLANVHYLSDAGLVELMIGYNPSSFAGVRITNRGIDLTENPAEFNRRFPLTPGAFEGSLAELPVLLDRLVEEVDLSALEGGKRQYLLRDVQYLREELSGPPHRWRRDVAAAVLGWLAEPFADADAALPSLEGIRKAIKMER